MMVARAVLLIVLCCVCALPDRATAQVSADTKAFKLLGSCGGVVNCVQKLDANRVVVGSGRRLVVLDVTNPAAITEIGSVDLGSTVKDFRISGTLAVVFTRCSPNWLCVVDLSNPQAPMLAWRSPPYPHPNISLIRNQWSMHPASEVDRVCLWGDYVYLLDNSQILVFRLHTSPPSLEPVGVNPSNVSALDLYVPPSISGSVVAFTVSGNLLYLTFGTQSGERQPLLVYDLAANPVSPPLLGLLWVGYPAIRNPDVTDISVENGVAALGGTTITPGVGYSGERNTVILVDVSNPVAPVQRGVFYSQNRVTGYCVTLANGRVYLGEGERYGDSCQGPRPDASEVNFGQGLIIIDASNLDAPQEVGFYRNPNERGFVRRTLVDGNRAYVCDEGQGLTVLDVSNPAAPIRLGAWWSPTGLSRMSLGGPGNQRMFVTDQWNGFWIIDVADPRHPVALSGYSSLPYRYDHTALDVSGDWAFLGTTSGGGPSNYIELVNVSNPLAPTFVGAFGPATVSALKVEGNILHADSRCGGGGGYRRFDISALPTVTEVCSASSVGADSLALGNGVLWGGSGYTAGLGRVLPPCDSAQFWPPPPGNSQLFNTEDLALCGNTLVTVSDYYNQSPQDQTVRLFDSSNPNAITVQSILTGNYGAFAVGSSGSTAFVLGTWPMLSGPSVLAAVQQVAAVDVSNPTSPRIVGRSKEGVSTGAAAYPRVLAAGDTVYLTNGLGGGVPAYDDGLRIYKFHCRADFDADGLVAPSDVAAFISEWFRALQAGILPSIDYDGNGLVQPADIAAFVNAWFNAITGGC